MLPTKHWLAARRSLHLGETPLASQPAGTLALSLRRTTRSTRALLRALRPHQWIKNAACLAGLIFSGNLFNAAAASAALCATAMFCMAASAVYIINDLADRKKDQHNPRKAHRPIASGALPLPLALVGCLLALGVSVVLALHLGAACATLLGLYLALNLAYSFRLKHAVLVDVMIIALGFVFRVLAGVYAIGVQPTAWIVLCIFFLALFLGFAKRRGELAALKENATIHRPVLAKYTRAYLDTLMGIMAAMTIICYAMYTVDPKHENSTMVVTLPPVVYGIARYALLVMVRGGESAEEMLTLDKGMIAAVLCWVGLCVLVLYGHFRLFQ